MSAVVTAAPAPAVTAALAVPPPAPASAESARVQQVDGVVERAERVVAETAGVNERLRDIEARFAKLEELCAKHDD